MNDVVQRAVAAGVSQEEIGREAGVSGVLVSLIRRGKRGAHEGVSAAARKLLDERMEAVIAASSAQEALERVEQLAEQIRTISAELENTQATVENVEEAREIIAEAGAAQRLGETVDAREVARAKTILAEAELAEPSLRALRRRLDDAGAQLKAAVADAYAAQRREAQAARDAAQGAYDREAPKLEARLSELSSHVEAAELRLRSGQGPAAADCNKSVEALVAKALQHQPLVRTVYHTPWE